MKLAVVPLPLYFTNFYHILNAATRPAEMIHMILHNIYSGDLWKRRRRHIVVDIMLTESPSNHAHSFMWPQHFSDNMLQLKSHLSISSPPPVRCFSFSFSCHCQELLSRERDGLRHVALYEWGKRGRWVSLYSVFVLKRSTYDVIDNDIALDSIDLVSTSRGTYIKVPTSNF